MKFILALALSLAIAPTLNTTAKAETPSVELQGMQAALDARNSFVQALQKKDFVQITHDALDHAIQELVEDLRSRNDEALAQELIGQWSRSEGIFFSGALTMGLLDLGDHAPLFAWLENLFSKMSEKYGDIIFTLPLVNDIRMMNFAIPVVFNPRGSWQSAEFDSRIEYRKHFIPFANLVTYYVSLYGCNYLVKKHGQPQLKKYCKKAAAQLKFLMGRYVAPMVSDWIFKASTRKMVIGKSQLRYMTAEELSEAIRTNNLY